MTNRLLGSTSAYLLQHVENPVDWWPWGNEALEEARRRDVPVFLSVGYSACHWCHVMASESFENEEIASFLNEHFVSIKVDREERPDVDALYMAATQLMSGHGGWPMSVFLLPDGRPFVAGTYYPPVDRGGQVGFPRLLEAVHEAWSSQRDVVIDQATRLSQSLAREIRFVDHLAPYKETLNLTAARQKLCDELAAQCDPDGGFSVAPKFPRPSFLSALSESDDPRHLDAATRTLDAMCRRGLYDHIEGGFARYSVDGEWHVPHFEKMLSDQALLARSYFIASARMNNPTWRNVALRTLQFVLENMRVSEGFASSLDADANHVEGSHIVWTPDEVQLALRDANCEQAVDEVLERWRITSAGEFEGSSIPRLSDGQAFETPVHLEPALRALQTARRRRVQPGRDEKVILEWNAMLASALLYSRDSELMSVGTSLLESLHESHFFGGVWWRTENRQAHATCADLAWLADACCDAYEVSGNDTWLRRAQLLCEELLAHYWDGDVPTVASPTLGSGFFTQSDRVTDVNIRGKEIFDGATPSSHAVSCRAFARVALLGDDVGRLVVAQRLVELGASLIATHPTAVPDLVEAAGFALEGREVVVLGPRNDLTDYVLNNFPARSVVIMGDGTSPLLKNRNPGLAYVCEKGVCQLPVSNVEALKQELLRAH